MRLQQNYLKRQYFICIYEWLSANNDELELLNISSPFRVCKHDSRVWASSGAATSSGSASRIRSLRGARGRRSVRKQFPAARHCASLDVDELLAWARWWLRERGWSARCDDWGVARPPAARGDCESRDDRRSTTALAAGARAAPRR